MLTLISPAADRNILTLAEIKAALSITDSDSDLRLQTLGLQVSDTISDFCGVVTDGMSPATLLSEKVQETIRLTDPLSTIILSRRFVSSISSITLAGVEVSPSLYTVDRASGLLRHIDVNGWPDNWPAGVWSITYVAGFASAPTPLKLAAATLLRDIFSTQDRDPLLRMEMVEGVGRQDFYQSASSSTGLPDAVTQMLSPYCAASI